MARKTLLSDRRGATAIEYGFLAGLIAIALLAVEASIGLSLANLFHKLAVVFRDAGAG